MEDLILINLLSYIELKNLRLLEFYLNYSVDSIASIIALTLFYSIKSKTLEDPEDSN